MPSPAFHQLMNEHYEAALSFEEEYVLVDDTKDARMDTQNA